MALREQIQHLGYVALRATGDSYFWLIRNYLWELALVVSSSIVSAVLGGVAGRSPWTIITQSIATGLLAIIVLLFIVWCYYLLKAPSVLRKRKLRQFRDPTASVRIEVRGAQTTLGARAINLIEPLRDFAEARSILNGRGPANEARLAALRKRALRAIEIFGEQAVNSGPEDTTREERRRAYRLYEKLQGFSTVHDPEPLVDEIRRFAIRPDGSITLLKKRLRNWFRRQWHKVR